MSSNLRAVCMEGLQNLKLAPDVCSRRQGSDPSKCLTTLASFGRHPDSAQGTFKEVRQTVQVSIRVQLALLLRSREYAH
jgi:hypothetical protein